MTSPIEDQTPEAIAFARKWLYVSEETKDTHPSVAHMARALTAFADKRVAECGIEGCADTVAIVRILDDKTRINACEKHVRDLISSVANDTLRARVTALEAALREIAYHRTEDAIEIARTALAADAEVVTAEFHGVCQTCNRVHDETSAKRAADADGGA